MLGKSYPQKEPHCCDGKDLVLRIWETQFWILTQQHVHFVRLISLILSLPQFPIGLWDLSLRFVLGWNFLFFLPLWLPRYLMHISLWVCCVIASHRRGYDSSTRWWEETTAAPSHRGPGGESELAVCQWLPVILRDMLWPFWSLYTSVRHRVMTICDRQSNIDPMAYMYSCTLFCSETRKLEVVSNQEALFNLFTQ